MNALSHPAMAVVVVVCFGFAVAGVGLILYVAWSLFWNLYDHLMERRVLRRARRRCVRVYLPPHHAVGRDAFREFKR